MRYRQSCLSCPLPKCKHDDPGWLRSYRRAQRDRRLLRVRSRENATVGELAQRFHISQRTVHRILARANGREASVAAKPLPALSLVKMREVQRTMTAR